MRRSCIVPGGRLEVAAAVDKAEEIARLEQQLAKAETEVERGEAKLGNEASSPRPRGRGGEGARQLAAHAPSATSWPRAWRLRGLSSAEARSQRRAGAGVGRPVRPLGRLSRVACGFGMRPGLERVSALLAWLAGRRCATASSTRGHERQVVDDALLRGAARATGCAPAPISHRHLRLDRARIVDGRPGDEAVFGAAVARVRAEAQGCPRLGETTQFEVLTVAALLAFAESEVEAVRSRPGWAGASMPPTWSRRRSSCSPTSGSSTPRCSATRAS